MIGRWFVGFVVFVGYLCLGAFVFYRIERNEEERRHYSESLERLELKGETHATLPGEEPVPGRGNRIPGASFWEFSPDDKPFFPARNAVVFRVSFRMISPGLLSVKRKKYLPPV